MNFCTRCLKRFAACRCNRRRRRATAPTVEMVAVTTADLAAEAHARLNAQNDSTQSDAGATASPPKA